MAFMFHAQKKRNQKSQECIEHILGQSILTEKEMELRMIRSLPKVTLNIRQ